jgi:hypothetical protein
MKMVIIEKKKIMEFKKQLEWFKDDKKKRER